MGTLTSQQINELADYFFDMAQSLGAFRRQQFDTLSKQQNKEIKDLQAAIINCADKLYTLSAISVIDDVRSSLSVIGKLTIQIKMTYQTLQDIQKGINIATSALNLGKAILKTDPQAIMAALGSLEENLNSNG